MESPVVPVLKPTGKVRLCIDFHKLNEITIQEHCYIMDIEDILLKVAGCSVLSKLDRAFTKSKWTLSLRISRHLYVGLEDICSTEYLLV